MSVWQQIQQTREELKLTLEESKQLGIKWVAHKAKYESVKARRALDLKGQGMAATVIDKVLKGDPDVNEAMYDMDVAEVEYRNAVEAINVLKKDYDFLREQYQREWNESGWPSR